MILLRLQIDNKWHLIKSVVQYKIGACKHSYEHENKFESLLLQLILQRDHVRVIRTSTATSRSDIARSRHGDLGYHNIRKVAIPICLMFKIMSYVIK